MRLMIIAAAALATVAAPAFAQDGVRAGQTIRDVAASRVGVIDRVLPDGSVQLIYGGRFVVIPADKVSVADGVVKTSLTKKEVSKLK